jgi:hypothetical protein
MDPAKKVDNKKYTTSPWTSWGIKMEPGRVPNKKPKTPSVDFMGFNGDFVGFR